MVNDDQEPRGAPRSEIEERKTHERPVRKIQARLKNGGLFVEAGILRRASQTGEIYPFKRQPRFAGMNDLLDPGRSVLPRD